MIYQKIFGDFGRLFVQSIRINAPYRIRFARRHFTLVPPPPGNAPVLLVVCSSSWSSSSSSWSSLSFESSSPPLDPLLVVLLLALEHMRPLQKALYKICINKVLVTLIRCQASDVYTMLGYRDERYAQRTMCTLRHP